jgi:hypothetical protein
MNLVSQYSLSSLYAQEFCDALLLHHQVHCSQVNINKLHPPFRSCTISYGDLCGAIGRPELTAVCHTHLHEIAEWCALNGYPPINALVVNKKTGVPGDGYSKAPGCDILTWEDEVKKVIAFRGYPSFAVFANPIYLTPSIGGGE